MIFSGSGSVPQSMTYTERELLKNSDFSGQEHLVIIMIAHWMRQQHPISFSEYAANWATAHDGDATKITSAFPLSGDRKIADGHSQWNTF